MFRIYINSNENPRTINTPNNARMYYTCFECATEEEVVAKYLELTKQGIAPYEMRTPKSNRCDVRFDTEGKPYVYYIPSRKFAFGCR